MQLDWELDPIWGIEVDAPAAITWLKCSKLSWY